MYARHCWSPLTTLRTHIPNWSALSTRTVASFSGHQATTAATTMHATTKPTITQLRRVGTHLRPTGSNRDTLRAVIADGTYDVFIVDATELAAGGWQLELTILAGEHKGELVTINAQGLEGEEFDLLGMPGTLIVADGSPSFRVDS